MTRRYIRRIMTVIATCLISQSVSAQPKSVGAAFSFTGLSLTYEHDFHLYGAFLEIAMKAEMSEHILERSGHPGISAGVVWNILIRQWTSSEGNALRFFAGPGVAAGYTTEYKSVDGIFFGLKGRMGCECEFKRNMLISMSISPIIGSHVTMPQGDLSMKYYKNGLIYSLVPEIGIKYRF